MKRTTGVSQLDSAMRANMSPLEVKLLETQDVMEVRGKVCIELSNRPAYWRKICMKNCCLSKDF